MKIFSVDHDEANATGQRYHATQGEAKKLARELANEFKEPVDVEACEVMAGKAGIIALANGPGWCVGSEVIYTAKPRGKRKADDDVGDLM